MQKDYWNISKRNFRALAVISIIFVLIFGLALSDSSNPDSVRMSVGIAVAFFLITTIVFFVLASLFKKHSPKAITFAYVYLGLSLIFSIISNFIMSPPTENIIMKIIGLLILAYLFVNVYKASKQTGSQSNVTN